jgi:N6-L-threonylcarbamoyladenine synthase
LRAAVNHRSVGLPVHFPSHGLSTDNAVMIAAAAFSKYRRGEFAPLSAPAEPNLELAGPNRELATLNKSR